MTESSVRELITTLIKLESITPNDGGCQNIINDALRNMGFDIVDVSSHDVTNTFARFGNDGPLLVFAGHTDVVPPGPLTKWISPPFEPTIRDGILYGRGAADMKSSIAAMVVACANFLKKHPKPKGSIGFMITSDEEATADHGTIKIVEYCKQHQIKVDYCLVGEPSSVKTLGDTVKVGRRGSLYGYLTVIGKQGHIAYPQLADNPIHRCFEALNALAQHQWDTGNDDFDPTSFQLYSIHADSGATNVIPGTLTAHFNFRFAPTSTADSLKQQVHAILDRYKLNYDLSWALSSAPFYSKQDKLLPACQKVIAEIAGIDTLASTTGGTSDGRFIIDLGCEIVELGPINRSIHHIDEHIALADLDQLTLMFERILEELLL